jgi:hypothetical protein
MTVLARLLTAATVAASAAAPLAAQYPYPTPYPAPYPAQPYGGNVIGQVLDQILGGRYAGNDRTAIQQCAAAAVAQAANQYSSYGGGYGYPQPYGGYANPYAANIRVTAITDVERRSDGLRVRGLLSSGMNVNQYGQYGQYVGPTYSGQGDLSFRCTVDYRGYVRDVRVRRR